MFHFSAAVSSKALKSLGTRLGCSSVLALVHVSRSLRSRRCPRLLFLVSVYFDRSESSVLFTVCAGVGYSLIPRSLLFQCSQRKWEAWEHGWSKQNQGAMGVHKCI